MQISLQNYRETGSYDAVFPVMKDLGCIWMLEFAYIRNVPCSSLHLDKFLLHFIYINFVNN